MGGVYLVSDTRERSVLGFIDTIFGAAGVGRTVAQINTGDYLICRCLPGGEPETLACVERKTLPDFAASFKDGRYANRLKMLDLRDRTGCQLFFFVEGPAFPEPTWRVSRIPYGNILAAMTHLMVSDGIHVVQTKNEMGTAQRLLDFARAFDSTDVPHSCRGAKAEAEAGEGAGEKAEAEEGAGAGAKAGAEAGAGAKAGTEAEAEAGEGAGAGAAARLPVPAEMMGLVQKDDALVVVEIWARLAGISMATAQIFAGAFSVADLVGGRVSAEALDGLRTPTGRRLAKAGRASLAAAVRGCQKTEARFLSGVPGVSPAMAAQVLAVSGGRRTTLGALLAAGPAATAEVAIQQRGRAVRLGPARAARIHRLMAYGGAAP